jgi:hypothetical protein
VRTALIIVGGLLLWGVCLGIARLVAGTERPAYTLATVVFVAAWLGLAATNLWVGVTKAGYTWREELPIFLAVFGLPAIVALVARRFL